MVLAGYLGNGMGGRGVRAIVLFNFLAQYLVWCGFGISGLVGREEGSFRGVITAITTILCSCMICMHPN